jgi:hypothetical protein
MSGIEDIDLAKIETAAIGGEGGEGGEGGHYDAPPAAPPAAPARGLFAPSLLSPAERREMVATIAITAAEALIGRMRGDSGRLPRDLAFTNDTVALFTQYADGVWGEDQSAYRRARHTAHAHARLIDLG